jgi:hypothetical protein
MSQLQYYPKSVIPKKGGKRSKRTSDETPTITSTIKKRKRVDIDDEEAEVELHYTVTHPSKRLRRTAVSMKGKEKAQQTQDTSTNKNEENIVHTQKSKEKRPSKQKTLPHKKKNRVPREKQILNENDKEKSVDKEQETRPSEEQRPQRVTRKRNVNKEPKKMTPQLKEDLKGRPKRTQRLRQKEKSHIEENKMEHREEEPTRPPPIEEPPKFDLFSILPIDDMHLTVEQLLDRLNRITENYKRKYKSNATTEERSGVLLSIKRASELLQEMIKKYNEERLKNPVSSIQTSASDSEKSNDSVLHRTEARIRSLIAKCEKDFETLKQMEAEAEKVESKVPIVVDDNILTESEKSLLEKPKLAFEREESKEFTVSTFLKMSELQADELALRLRQMTQFLQAVVEHNENVQDKIRDTLLTPTSDVKEDIIALTRTSAEPKSTNLPVI